MNDYDRENLDFLLNATPEVLLEWYNTVDEDDHEYASELMAQYSQELKIRQSLIDIEEINLDNLIPDAQTYLQKFRLVK